MSKHREPVLSQHPHLDAEKLLHLLRLLGIRATYQPLCSVGVSVAGTCGYFFDGKLGYRRRGEKAVRINPDLSTEPLKGWSTMDIFKEIIT